MRGIRKGEWYEIIIPDNWIDLTIEDVLKEKWHVPKGLLHQYRMGHAVKVNHEVRPWAQKLHKNDKLSIQLFSKEEFGVIPEYGDFELLYEDDHLLIANKPAGIDTHPNEKGQLGTLSNFIAYHYLTNGDECKVQHIHRLDKGTSGAILFAKHPLAKVNLDRMLEKREIRRTYLAVVKSLLKQKKGVINAPIGRDRHHGSRRRVSQGGQPAITYFQVLETDPIKKTTLVMLQLKTGRTHQIRVHMSHIGAPLVGDTLYGGKTYNIERPLLHAAHLSFTHPITSEAISCIAPFLDKPAIFPNIDMGRIEKMRLY